MNVNQALRRLKIMLSSQYKFAEAELVDGTHVYTEGELEVGAILFVKAGEGISEDPFAPAGMHETLNGTIVTVGENGEITKISNKNKEEKIEVELEEVKVEEPVAEEVLPTTEDLLSSIAELIEPFFKEIKSLNEEIKSLNEEVDTLKKRFETMAAEPGASKVKNTFANVLADKNDATAKRLEVLAKMRKSK
jgi:hypothetical protein